MAWPMREEPSLPRRELLRQALAGVVGLAPVAGLSGCVAMLADARRRYGWEAAAALDGGPYRALIWEPIGGHTTPIFVVVLLARDARGTIVEPYGVTDRGEVSVGPLVAELRQRYPNLDPSDVEVEPLDAGGAPIGSVIRTRNIRVYADFDRSAGQYSIRLNGLGKWPRRAGGGPGGGGR